MDLLVYEPAIDVSPDHPDVPAPDQPISASGVSTWLLALGIWVVANVPQTGPFQQ